MAITFVGGVGNSNAASGTTLTTGSYTVTAGSLLVAVWRHNHNNVSGTGTPTITISDSSGNTWTNAASQTLGVAGVIDGMRAGIAYAMNAAAGSTTFTFTISDSRDTRGIAILEYSGVATSSALSATGTSGTTAGSVITSSAFSTSGNTLTVAVANTINNGNLVDWTGLTVAGNASTGRSPAAYDTLAYIRDYISTGAFSSVTSSASNNNSAAAKLIVSASFAEAPAITYTYSRPSSDVTTQWTPSSGTLHYALINETTYDDANYIAATAVAQTDEVGLQAMTAPQAGTSVLVNYRVRGIAGGGAVTVSLYSGATLVKTDTTRIANNDAITPIYTMTVTAAEWGAVAVNWSNMRLRFVSA